MAVIGVVGAKGGCGGSLLATNLGVALAANASCLLIDLNPIQGVDDLLLDIAADKPWSDLLPVARELTEHHLNLTTGSHASGLRILAAPPTFHEISKHMDLTGLLNTLKNAFTWLVLDLPISNLFMTSLAFPIMDNLLIVSTMDPPSLRSAKRLTNALPEDLLKNAGIVFNQVTRGHPVDPESAASSLELPLMAKLKVDHDAIGRQVNFGMPCVGDPDSQYGNAVSDLATRIVLFGPDDLDGLRAETPVPMVGTGSDKEGA